MDLGCAFLQWFVFHVTSSNRDVTVLVCPVFGDAQMAALCIFYEPQIFAFLAAHMQFFSNTFHCHYLGIFLILPTIFIMQIWLSH